MLCHPKFVFTFLLLLSFSLFATEEKNNSPLHRRFYIWPDFCLEHVITDPDSISSWNHNYSEGPILDDEYFDEEDNKLQLPARFDLSLIDQVRDYYKFIPKLRDKHCDYIFCTQCNSPVIRERETLCGGFHDDRKMNFPIRYYCNCDSNCYGVDFRYVYWFQEKVIANWKFSECPPVWSGYFQKYRSPFFKHFVELLQLCEQNAECRCYWPEESSQMKKILDEIFISFLELENPDITEAEICNIFDSNWYDCGLDALDNLVTHLSHSFLYSQLKESLYKLDPYVSCWFHTPKLLYKAGNKSKIINAHTAYCESLLQKIRPMFLEMYQNCYKKHPHPKIEEEIRILTCEIQN